MLPTIKHECSQFLKECNNLFLLKNLPKINDGFKRVKVRIKNKNEIVIEAFNKSFSNHKNIFQRSIFANGESSFKESEDKSLEPFYIFPIDGYKFIYNPAVTDAFNDYKKSIKNIMPIVTSNEVIVDVFSTLIKENYISNNLTDGIKVGAEIIFYNIPYYYAIRKSIVDDYNILS